MWQRRALCAGWVVFSLACLPQIVLAADWPQWGGRDGRNMASQEEESLPAWFAPGKKKPDGSGIDLKTTKNVKWVARLGTENYSSPVVANGKVFIGTNDMLLDDPRRKSTGGGLLLCLDAATGRLLWRFVCPKLETDRDKVSPDFEMMSLGICSTPAVEGDRVYAVTNRCEVVCLDVHGMADVIWRFDMLHEAPTFAHDAANCSVLVHGDLLYVGTGNGVDGARPSRRGAIKTPLPNAPSLIVLDKRTGRLVAKEGARISSRVFHGQWSSPSLGKVGERALVFYGGGDGICYAFEALPCVPEKPVALKTAWSFDCNPPKFRLRDGKPIDYWAGDKRRNRGNKNDGLYYGPCEIIATPVFYDNRVYVAIGQDPLHGRGKGVLHCIDATQANDISTTGKVWSYEFERTTSTVSIAGGLLFVADFAGRIHCLDLDSGQPCWVHETGGDTWSSTLVADGKVYLGTRKGLCVLAAAKEKKVLAEIPLGSPVRSSPAAANGVLYVASQRYLWAVQAKP